MAALLLLASCNHVPPAGSIVQDDAHEPRAWRVLRTQEQQVFDTGYATYNTEWSQAGRPAGRTDGLGPLFNSQSCDSCHNSRRRGRGPRTAGVAPSDLVLQLASVDPDGSLRRGSREYGYILNTAALPGFTPEAEVRIAYAERPVTLADGSSVSLRAPTYEVRTLSGAGLAPATVLMPRMPPTVMGVGLLEMVPQAQVLALAAVPRANGVAGRPAWIESDGRRVIGRFGWQATEATVATQTAVAMSREMGLTSPLIAVTDCGEERVACEAGTAGAARKGAPEVEPELFHALLLFQQLHALPALAPSRDDAHGARLFTRTGCAACHVPVLTAELPVGSRRISPYTDLLLHDLGDGLADRNVRGEPVRSRWRTAPLWGLQASFASSQPPRLLHDGRARSIAEAVLWHEGEGGHARARFMALSATERAALVTWIARR